MRNHHNRAAAALAAALLSVVAAPANAQDGPGVVVTATRLEPNLPIASTTIIDSATIERSPARSMPELLSLEAGVQSRDLFGGTSGARGTVDMRGFGAAAKSNTLILVDGRRLNTIDLTAIDFANIPLESIDRIEVTRGAAGAVLYGDGAVGGAINIITKPASRREPGAKAAASLGSDRYRGLDLSANQSVGPVSVSAFGAFTDTDGYRDHNKLVQRNMVAEVRHQGDRGDVFGSLQLDDQSLELPGARRVTLTSNQLTSDPRGATTPFDQADQNGIAVTLGATREIGDDVELIVDGGVLRKDQEGIFISAFGAAFDTYVDTDLTTWSLTPRVRADSRMMGRDARIVGGIDVYFSDYNSDRQNNPPATPVHRYDAKQTSAAAYGQVTVGVAKDTDVTAGLRLQHVRVTAGDIFNAAAPGAFGAGRQTLRDNETHWAANLGIEQRIGEALSLFLRGGRSIRVPTIDDRIGATGTTFMLNTQTGYDAELGGRYERDGSFVQASAYVMDLRNEIHFDPNVNFGTTINLDPTRRYGVEIIAGTRLTETVSARANLAVTQAKFTEGPYDGNDVPLVAPYTASGTIDWMIVKGVTFTGVVTYVSEKRLDNDQANFQPKIPDYVLVDLKIGGHVGPFDWSAQVNNLFDKDYFNYGVASATTYGTYNAYPLPGRTFLVRLGGRF